MRKYNDMWIGKDSDGRYYIAYVEKGDGHTKIKPFTFSTFDAAQNFVNTVFIKE